MKFKDTEYGDLTGQTYEGALYVKGQKLTSLEGAPKEITGALNIEQNDIKDPLNEIVKYGIRAEYYWTDKGGYTERYVIGLIDKYETLSKRVTRQSMRTLLGLDK